MTAPIDPSQGLARLAALMRQSSGGVGPSRGAAEPAASAASTAGAQAAAVTLRQQLKAIAPDHPRRRRAMARVLIESVLADEFGAGTVNEAGFQNVVDEVLDAMQRHAGTAAELDRLLESLTAEV
jgi:hypothetical protein